MSFEAAETTETDRRESRLESAGSRINEGFSSLGGGSAGQPRGAVRGERRSGMATRRRTRRVLLSAETTEDTEFQGETQRSLRLGWNLALPENEAP